MRKTTALVLALTFILSMCALIPAASAASPYYIKTSSGKSVILREEPTTDSRALLQIPYGDEFWVSEFLGNGWAYGHWGGAFGYVASRFLVTTKPGPYKPSGSSTSTSSKQSTDQQLDNELKTQRDVDPFTIEVRASRVSGSVNFRVGPSVSSTRITSLRDGKELVCTGETKNWYRARDPETGKTGYIAKNYAVKISNPIVFTTKNDTATKKTLGALNVNGQFELVCQLPDGYDLQVVNMRGGKIIASIIPKNTTRPEMFLTIAYDETYGDVERLNDLTDEELAILEASFTEMNQVDITYRQTGYGTKLLVARETGADMDFVDILSIYKGYFIEFNMTPNEKAASKVLTDQQIKVCIDFLTNLDFVPITAK